MLDRLKLQHLRYFIAVAEELHFSRAAQKVALSAWDLSEQVRSLEDMLGVTLLIRHPHQMELTPAGEMLLRGANELLRDTLQLLKQVQDLGEAMQEQVRLGYFAPELEPLIIATFGRLISEGGVNLTRLNLPESALQQALLNRHIDVAVGRLMELQNETLACEVLQTGHWGLVLKESHALAAQEHIAPADLRTARLLLLSGHEKSNVMDQFHNLGVEPEVVYQPAQSETAEVMVEQGTGLWLTSSFMAETLPPGLVFRPLEGFAEMELALAWRQGDTSGEQIRDWLKGTG